MPPLGGVQKKKAKKKQTTPRPQRKDSPEQFVERHAECAEIHFYEKGEWECETCGRTIEENEVVDKAFTGAKVFSLLEDWNNADDDYADKNGLDISNMEMADDIAGVVASKCTKANDYSIKFIRETSRRVIAGDELGSDDDQDSPEACQLTTLNYKFVSTDQREKTIKILNAVRSRPDLERPANPEAVTIGMLMKDIKCATDVPPSEVSSILDILIWEGLIYSTVDDDHWAATFGRSDNSSWKWDPLPLPT